MPSNMPGSGLSSRLRLRDLIWGGLTETIPDTVKLVLQMDGSELKRVEGKGFGLSIVQKKRRKGKTSNCINSLVLPYAEIQF